MKDFPTLQLESILFKPTHDVNIVIDRSVKLQVMSLGANDNPEYEKQNGLCWALTGVCNFFSEEFSATLYFDYDEFNYDDRFLNPAFEEGANEVIIDAMQERWDHELNQCKGFTKCNICKEKWNVK